MIRIAHIEPEPIAELRYLNARSGGGSEVTRLEILRAEVGPLADELDAIVCCSDLQGVLRGELLGVGVAEQLSELAESRVLPPAARTGIVLAGDLYSEPGATKRGGFGDVADVWVAFAERFAWVAGVAGHDDMTNTLRLGARIHVLDGETVVVDGLRIGGVGGIIGNKKKPGRRSEEEQLDRILAVIEERCDLVVLHEGPHGGEGQRGHEAIRLAIETGEVPLTVCGHAHWHQPLAEHAHGQILNVDARVVVLAHPK